MAAAMTNIVKRSLPNAVQVTDRFHVQQLASQAVRQMRIEYRWEAIDQENKEIELDKEQGKAYIAQKLENGDTLRQLLARSRNLLFKSKEQWNPSQIHRAELLFERYPLIEKAYKLSRCLAQVYQNTKSKSVVITKLAQWHNQVEKAEFKYFNTVSKTIQNNYQTILNIFNNRSTNASAESFNAKIKAFRSQFIGVRNVKLFLFRLWKIYA